MKKGNAVKEGYAVPNISASFVCPREGGWERKGNIVHGEGERERERKGKQVAFGARLATLGAVDAVHNRAAVVRGCCVCGTSPVASVHAGRAVHVA